MTSLRGWIVAAVLAALFVTITGLAWVFRAPIAMAAVESGLASAGLEGEVTVDAIGLSQARLSGLRLGAEDRPAVRAESVELGFGLLDLFAMRIRRLRAEGLEVNAELREAGPALIGLPLAAGGAQSRGGPTLPQHVDIENAVVSMETPAGRLVADLDLVGGSAEGWRLTVAGRPARVSQGDAVVDVAAAELAAVLNAEGATLDARVTVAELAAGDWRADEVDIEVRFSGEAADPTDPATIDGAGALVLTMDSAGMGEDAARRLAALVPEMRDEAGVFAAPHLDALRVAMMEALQGFDVEARALIASSQGRVHVVPDGVVRASAESGALLTLEAGPPPTPDAASFLSFDPATNRFEAQALRAGLSGTGAPSLTVDVTRAALQDGPEPAASFVGGVDLQDWRVDGFAIGVELSAFAFDWAGQEWRLTPKGAVRLDGQRGELRVRAGQAAFDADMTWADGRLAVDWRTSPNAAGRDPAPFVLTAASAGYGELEFGRMRIVSPWPETRASEPGLGEEIRPPVLALGPAETSADFPFANSLVTVIADGGSVTAELPAGYARLENAADGVPALSFFVQGPRAGGATGSTGDLTAAARTLELDATLGQEPLIRALVTRLNLQADDWPLVFANTSADMSATLRDGRPHDGRFAIAATVCEPNAEDETTGRELDPCDSPPTLAPLVIEAEADIEAGVAEGEASLAFETPALDALGGTLALGDARYRFDLANGSGEASLASTRLAFAPNRNELQPQQVVRALAGVIAEVRGAARVEAAANWSPGSLAVSARVNIEELDFQTPVGRVVGLRTDFTIDDLAALQTSEPQLVTVDLFDPGVPLENARFTIDLRGDVAILESAAFPFAGGVLQLDPVEWIFGDLDHRVRLAARDIDLAEVLALRPTPGLEISGLVQGGVPVVIGERSIVIDNARLSTTEPGAIRYVGPGTDSLSESGGEATQLAFGALRNFQYESLALTVNGDVAGDMTVRLEARGQNPDMEGPFRGRVINLNMPITANFGNLLRRAAGIQDPRDTIREAREAENDQ